MQNHLYQHLRDANGHIIATLAINKNRNIGMAIHNELDKANRRQRALLIASARADEAKGIHIPDRWVTPKKFTERRSKSPVANLLAVKLSVLLQEEAEKLMQRADSYFKK